MSLPKPGEKRQRSIADMFGGKPTTTPTPKPNPSAASKNSKKPKTNNVKPVASSSKTAMIRTPYNKLPPIEPETKLTSLSSEHRELLALELNAETGIGISYLKALHQELTRTYFLDLKRFLKTETSTPIFPPAPNIYSWSRRTPLTGIKVVIIGQDPYHGPGQAHGLAFSVPRGIPIPGSLRNIHEELKREYQDEFKKPNHGSLGTWADHGVLLLNTSLTVRKASAGSHAGRGWEQFTDSVVDAIDLYGGLDLLQKENVTKEDEKENTKEETGTEAEQEKTEENEEGPSLKRQKIEDDIPKSLIDQSSAGFGKGVVFLCWGKWAADRVARLSESKHLILRSAHPSPLSAHRGFLGNGHFKLANEWLASRYGESAMVDWCDLKPDLPINNPLSMTK